MNKKGFGLLAVAGGAAFLIARTLSNTANALKRLEYLNPKIKFGSLSLTSIPCEISLELRNPGSADIPLDYFTGDILYQGRRLSNFTFNQAGKNFVIKGRSTTRVPFTVNISTISAISIIVNLIKAIKGGGGVSSIISINGSIYAAGFDVPVKFDYDLRSNTVIKANAAIAGAGKAVVNGIAGINTKGTYFFGGGDDIDNLDDLRKKFYKLSKKYHPDAGGTNEDFQQLQNEYETLKYRIYNNSGFTKEQVDVEVEIDGVLNEIYQTIMNIPGITIEVVGKWLWISGNTYPVKDQLKAAGLKFASTKKMWYFAGTEYKGKGATLAIDDIRKKYGSQVLQTGKRHYLSGHDDLVHLFERLKFLLVRRKK